jgi:hypothetical protein
MPCRVAKSNLNLYGVIFCFPCQLWSLAVALHVSTRHFDCAVATKSALQAAVCDEETKK